MKNLIIIVLALFAIEFAVQSNRNGQRQQQLQKVNQELISENQDLRLLLDSLETLKLCSDL